MKAEVGPDYPVICRINCSDFAKGGFEFFNCFAASGILQIAGADAIHLTRKYKAPYVVEIKPTSVIVRPPNGWLREILDVDNAVLATGAVSKTEMVSGLFNTGYRVLTVGDDKEPRRVLNSIEEGTFAGIGL